MSFDFAPKPKQRRFTAELRERLLAEQGGVCAACGADDPGSHNGWHVDHCHKSQAVRGVLCRACNLTLGYVKDDPERLELLLAYLLRFQFDGLCPEGLPRVQRVFK